MCSTVLPSRNSCNFYRESALEQSFLYNIEKNAPSLAYTSMILLNFCTRLSRTSPCLMVRW